MLKKYLYNLGSKEYRQENYYRDYTILFVLMAIVIFLPFLLKGNSFVGRADGYNQCFPVLAYSGEYYRDLIKNIFDEEIVQFDFSIGYGDDVIGTLNYPGFGSLFSVCSLFIPERYSAYLYTVLLLIKVYLSGIIFLYYLKVKCYNTQKEATLLAACMYVFSTYTFFYGMQDPKYLDIMVFLPLAVAGIERLLQGKGKLLIPSFLFAFWAQALSGFYFFYMLTIFCVIYFVVCGIIRLGNVKAFFQKLGIVALNYLLAIGLSAIIFIPSVLAFFGSSRNADSGFQIKDIFQWYDLDTMISKLNTLFIKEGYQSGLGLPIFCGLLLILLVCGGYTRKYKEYKVLLLLFGIGYFLPIFGSMMNGFAYTTDRWMFMLIFLLASLTGELFSEEQLLSRRIVVSWGILVLLWVGIFCISHEPSRSMVLEFFVYAAMWICVSVILVWFFRKGQAVCMIKQPIFYICCLGTIVVSSFLLNAPVSIGGGGWSACFWSMKDAYPSIINSAANNEQEDSGEFYRMDISDASLASSLVLDYNGTTCYYSIFNSHIYDFYRELKISPAIRGSSFCVKGLDDREILQNLLSVKYSMNEEGNLVEHDDYTSFGILYNSYCLEEDVEELSALERELLLQDCVILSKYLATDGIGADSYKDSDYGVLRDAVTQIDYNMRYENIEYTGDELKVSSEGAILLEWEENADTEHYILLKNLVLQEGDIVEIEVGSKSIQLRSEENRSYLNGDNDYLIHVSDKEGRSRIVFPSGSYCLDDIELYEVNISRNAGGGINQTNEVKWSFGINRISGKVAAEEESILFLSIPYSQGWEFKIDGNAAEYYCADWGFTAIVLPTGIHEIEADYHTPGLKAGIIIDMISIIVLIALIVYQRKIENI